MTRKSAKKLLAVKGTKGDSGLNWTLAVNMKSSGLIQKSARLSDWLNAKRKSKISLGFLSQTTKWICVILVRGTASPLNSRPTRLSGSSYPSHHAVWWHQHMHAHIFTKVDDVRAVAYNLILHCYSIGFVCLWKGSWVVFLRPLAMCLWWSVFLCLENWKDQVWRFFNEHGMATKGLLFLSEIFNQIIVFTIKFLIDNTGIILLLCPGTRLIM